MDGLDALIDRVAMRVGVPPDWVDRLLRPLAVECAYLLPGGHVDRRGGSRIGGLPDLPDGVPWPTGLDEAGHENGRATFLAQLDLARLPPLADAPVPSTGHLWLFARRWADGLDMAAVYDVDTPSRKLTPRHPPAGEVGHGVGELVGQPVDLRFARGLMLPVHIDDLFDRLQQLNPAQERFMQMDLFSLIAKTGPRNAIGHVGGYTSEGEIDLYRWSAFRQLGRPDARWADGYATVAEYEAALTTPLPFGNPRAHRAKLRKRRPDVLWIDAHRDAIAAEAAAWRVLVEFGRGAPIEIGDGMHLATFARRADLAAGRFGHVVGECPMVL